MSNTTSGKNVDGLPSFLSAMDIRREKLQESGEWYTTTNAKGVAHFFLCANPKAETAVSMCATQVEKIEDLHTFNEGKVCLTCSLYEQSGKGVQYQERMEARKKHAARVQKILDDREERKEQERKRRSKGRKAITRQE